MSDLPRAIFALMDEENLDPAETVGVLMGVCWYIAMELGVPAVEMYSAFETIGDDSKRGMH